MKIVNIWIDKMKKLHGKGWEPDLVIQKEQSIKEILLEDTRQKKKTAHRSGGSKSGSGRRLYLPADLMSKEQRKEYERSGNVLQYNINELMEYEKFRSLTEDDQRKIMEHWRNDCEFTITQIQAGLGIGADPFGKIYKSLNPVITNPKILEQLERGEKIRAARQAKLKSMTEEEKLKEIQERAARKAAKKAAEAAEAERRAEEARKAEEEEKKALEKAQKKIENQKIEIERIREQAKSQAKQAELEIKEAQREAEAAVAISREALEKEKALLEVERQKLAQAMLTQATTAASNAFTPRVSLPVISGGQSVEYAVPEVTAERLRFHIDIEGDGPRNLDRINRLLDFIKHDGGGQYRIIVQVEEL